MKLVRDSLQVKSYQTIVAETGEEGVHLAHERQSALILMDVPLQGVNGVEALHRLRADPSTSRTPVTAVTASVMTQDQTRIMAAGSDGFPAKPISVRQLLTTVREIPTGTEAQMLFPVLPRRANYTVSNQGVDRQHDSP